MRKWIWVLLAVGAVAASWWYVRTYVRVTPPWMQPKFGKIDRGDIRVPVTASGLVEPHERIEIKSEASGEVISIPVVEGSYIRVGDVLCELDPDDEERNVDRAQAALDRVEALLAQAKVAVLRAKENVNIAEARLAEYRAQEELTRIDYEEELRLFQKGIGSASAFGLQTKKARFDTAVAQVKAAESAVVNAQHDIADAEAQVANQEANVREATKALEDAQKRLRETKIISKLDGIVTEVRVSVGTLVQSGTQNAFSGGTVLMTVADLSRMKVVARVDEADYGAVRSISPIDALPEVEELRSAAQREAEAIAARGGKVKITVDAFRDEEFEGEIERVEPQGRLNAGSAIIQFNVHVNVTDEKRYMLPLGTQAQVEFTVQSAQNVLRVPAEAVKSFQEAKGVWLRVPPAAGSGEQLGKRFVPCRFGITDGEFTEVVDVLGGGELKEGQEVYTARIPSDDGEERD